MVSVLPGMAGNGNGGDVWGQPFRHFLFF
jgi:hypothetical protein